MGSIPVAGAITKESALVVDSFVIESVRREATPQAKRSGIGFATLRSRFRDESKKRLSKFPLRVP